MTDGFRLERVDAAIFAGIGEAALRLHADRTLPGPATPVLRGPLPEGERAGPAWRDGAWADELEAGHLRLGAGEASLRALGELRRGEAGCVVTGQQPGLLGGPLYCAYKIAGAVALARRLSRPQRPVVPVYWCGGDDSDFDEARSTWWWSAGGPLRAEIPAAEHRAGQRVGDVDGRVVATIESGALRHAGPSGEGASLDVLLETLDPGWDLGERIAALYLRLFREAGLVVVDARSARLRELGRPLFLEYARRHRELLEGLDRRRSELEAVGLPRPIAEDATRSGLFALEGDRRRKLAPEELDSLAERPMDLAPSVLLRPLWQDQQLGPTASVLGPSELAYHAQIAPLYGALGVRPARPAWRPHLAILGPGLPWPAEASARRELLAGGDAMRDRLFEAALPAAWRGAAEAGWSSVREGLERLRLTVGDEPGLRRAEGRLRAEWERAVAGLREPALRARDGWSTAPVWLAVRGVPQERAYAATVGWWRWGPRFDALVEELGAAWLRALEEGVAPTFVAHDPAANEEDA